MKKRFFFMFCIFLLISQVKFCLALESTVQTVWEVEVGSWFVGTLNETYQTDTTCEGSIVISKQNDGTNLRRGFVLSNKTLIPLKTFFSGNESSLTKSITLETNNRIIVVIFGEPGASIQIELTNELPLDPNPELLLSATPNMIQPGEAVTLSWESANVDSLYIDNQIGMVSQNGSITVYPSCTTRYTITATGHLGSIGSQALIQVVGTPEPFLPGTFGKQYEHLIPVDTGMISYDPVRFSIINGAVHDSDGSAIVDAVISILDYPEYGTSHTNEDGSFSLPVEGGKAMTVVCSKQGWIESHRKIYVPWNDIVQIDTVHLESPDHQATTIRFDESTQAPIVHRSSTTSDAFGNRSCSLVFDSDNLAFMLDENGTDVMVLPSITVRATEFPTPESMPAKLPPSTAFTYCVELSADGVKNVRFAKPVTLWVNNFLGFEVGETIPVGFYNREKGYWIPSDNGNVVLLLDLNSDGFVDALDSDGDNLPNDLDGDGTYLNEVAGLQDDSYYTPGTTFWRVMTTHFTPCDLNLPQGSPSDATWPNPALPPKADTEVDSDLSCLTTNASFVEDRSRVFYEDIPIPGTNLSLCYNSSRVNGYQTLINVPVSGSSVPASLKRIEVELEIAGRTFSKEVSPIAEQFVQFYWDNKDFQGNYITTPISAIVRIGFVYDGTYYRSSDDNPSFGLPGIETTGIPTREEIILWEQVSFKVHPPASKSRHDIANGWTLSSHHHMNLQDQSTLHKGNGFINKTNIRTINAFAGTGNGMYNGDGIPAVSASLKYPSGIAVDGTGSVYILDNWNVRTRKVGTDGLIETIAGTGAWGFSGDSGPAKEATFSKAFDLALDGRGNLFVADSSNFRVRKIRADGIIETVCGTGEPGYSGDNGSAIHARVSQVHGLAVDTEGILYIADTENHCIRKIDNLGIISTIAGTGISGYEGDGGRADQALLNAPHDVAVDIYGNIIISDTHNHCIRRVDTNGIISTIAGTGVIGFSGDGQSALQAQLNSPNGIDVDKNGNIYFVDENNSVIRLINVNGDINTIAGSGLYAYDRKTGPAVLAKFRNPQKIALDDAGNIFVTDTNNHLVKKIWSTSTFAPIMASGGSVFAEDNGQGHVISIDGRHVETVDLYSGQSLTSFEYNNRTELNSISDRFGNRIELVRDTNGNLTRIVSPHGITTELIIDESSNLSQIIMANGSRYEFNYLLDGLLALKLEPNGNPFEHTFDENGRLESVVDNEDGTWNYEQSILEDGATQTQITTSMGNVTRYLDHIDSTGNYASSITTPNGSELVYTNSNDGLTVEKKLPCGLSMTATKRLDSAFQFPYISNLTATTPDGIVYVESLLKENHDANFDGVLDLFIETETINDRQSSTIDNHLTSEKMVISPEGRTATIQYDPVTRLPNRIVSAGLYDREIHYDEKGRPTILVMGSRGTNYTYNESGFISSISKSPDLSETYLYDDIGNIIQYIRPDGTSANFSYDQNGNITILSNPDHAEHVFEYNDVNMKQSYHTPISGSYRYEFNGERKLTRVRFPSDRIIENIYNDQQLVQIQTPETTIDLTYHCGNQVASISNGSDIIEYEYDGNLLKQESLNGILDQNLSYEYNEYYEITALTYAQKTTPYSYDKDGLLTRSGDFNIIRNVENGLPELVTSDLFRLERAFNGYGETDAQSLSVNNAPVSSWNLIRDDMGRIIRKTEAFGENSINYGYAYDNAGRLLRVTHNDVLVEEYLYNTNGARIYEMNALREILERHYTYSQEDHLLNAGTTFYQYDSDGFLTRKTDGNAVTLYDYSSRGELMRVVLPDSTVIEYLHDPMGRRLAKMIDGQIVEKYLWQGMTKLLAVYDENDNLLMRFEYADGRVPFAMMSGSGTYYLSFDHAGSLRLVTDELGNVIKVLSYDSFGNTILDTNQFFKIPFGYGAGLLDRETNLLRFGFRDYDPDIGRWTAKDPIFFAGGDVDIYSYCLNDPINSIDPVGLQEWSLVSSYQALHNGYNSPKINIPWNDYNNFIINYLIYGDLPNTIIDTTAQKIAVDLTDNYINPTLASVLRKTNFFLGIFDPFPREAHAPETFDNIENACP